MLIFLQSSWYSGDSLSFGEAQLTLLCGTPTCYTPRLCCSGIDYGRLELYLINGAFSLLLTNKTFHLSLLLEL